MTDLPADPRSWNDDRSEGDAYLQPRPAAVPARGGRPEVPPKPVKVLPAEPVAEAEAEPTPVVYDSLAALAPRTTVRTLIGPLLGVALVGVGLGFLLARTAGTSDTTRSSRTVVTPPPPLVTTTVPAVLGTSVRPTSTAAATTAAATTVPATTAPATTASATPSTTVRVGSVAPATTVTTATAGTTAPATTVGTTPSAATAPAVVSGVDVAAPVRYAEFSGGKVFLHGRVPTAELRDTIRRKVGAVVGPQNVFDDYVIDPTTPDVAGGPLKVLDTVQFESDSAVLRPAFTQILELGVILMNQNPAVTITVVGRSDARGSATYNLELSQRRAAAVVDYIVSRGIDRDRLTVDARGADDPLALGDDDASNQANRSVEFVILGLID